MDTKQLVELGVSMAMASYLVKLGWMYRLSPGAYMLVGDKPTRDGAIAFLSRKIQGLHVGGKTALAWRGVRHNIAFRERVVLWGRTPYKFPEWVSGVMLYSYQTTLLFDEGLAYESWLTPLPVGHSGVLVSSVERGLLELVSDVGKGQSLEEANNLAVSLRTLRIPVLDALLSHCPRVKVVRLVRDLGLAAGYEWGRDLQKHVDRISKGKRWSVLTKQGERLTLKP
ncbi:type IV toxin-antitoxin system AbiEi family antitoxin [Chromobacterium sp. S0633]|nr:type IV toxin-antitoxin system AbiEi family antitoxin [Chromobacterium sp. S0633]